MKPSSEIDTKPIRKPAPRPPIERYLRCSVEIPDGSVEMGLEVTGLADRQETRTVLRAIATMAYMRARLQGGWATTEELADVITPDLEANMDEMWPNRPWFVEVWSSAEALTQVYAPLGMPIR